MPMCLALTKFCVICVLMICRMSKYVIVYFLNKIHYFGDDKLNNLSTDHVGEKKSIRSFTIKNVLSLYESETTKLKLNETCLL